MSLRHTLLTLLFGGTLGLFLQREQERGTLEPFDRVHREFLKANPSPHEQGTPLKEPAIVFGRIDDRDQLNRIFSGWPLAEGDWQVVLQNLAAYKPKATAITAPLPFAKAGSGLAAAAAEIPALSSSAPASASPGDGSPDLPEGLAPLKVDGSVLAIPEAQSLRPPAIPGGWAPGEIDMLPAAQRLTVEGDWCRVPLLTRVKSSVLPAPALRALLDWAGLPLSGVTVQPGVAIRAGKSLRIPIDDSGCFRYYLSLAPDIPAVNADTFVLTRDNVLSGLAPDDPQRRTLESLGAKLLWFGHDDAASRVLKLPNGTPVSPAALTARAIGAIQTARFMRPLPPPLQWIPAGTTLLFCLWLARWRKSRLLPGALTAAAALIAFSLFLYRETHHWMPLGPSLGLLGATVILGFLLPAPRAAALPETAPPPPSRPVREITRGAAAPGTAEAPALPGAPTIEEAVPRPEPPAAPPAIKPAMTSVVPNRPKKGKKKHR